ncbi:pilus (MSHA type) biogenesis protein MshL [Colwellia sp. MB02u-14]|nr:pilus (MSHA type) biogenesis protein MshL [Colwellia sp. MB02u-14]MBA6232105.1 pilus (MSHA type) biogenesis protein MshL [Colwellia sp. MB02u-7]MBA6237197.1 pilus (MSHA type) biogenesis protein MshL [Colwellia sp. MB02u-11]MBA6257371.1 pilus (MSHA type) biogenesis protein MshL [Colwellia sp. MB3u-28]MBA6260443.1 pilus (MSHA type) biogenesis protein MshL [Colwellia sp. MB3u-41]MBA6301539.1 pilus (MSHA type) biogenesis protein MshL [Colwellia sp. MB3u-22]MBA6311425.1 pilus (MSHA type) biogen
MKNTQRKIYSFTLILALLGCQTAPNKPTEMIDALDKAIEESSKPAPKALTQVPNAIQQELMQRNISQAREGLLAEKRLEIAASDVSAQEFFAALVDESSYSVAVHPDVTGTITLNLKNNTLNEVLDVVEEVYGYEIRRNGKVIQVYPAGIRTETIPLNYLFVKRSGMSSTSINSGGVSENDQNNSNNNSTSNSNNSGSSNGNSQNTQQGSSGINIYTETKSDFWTELQENLTVLVGTEEGRSVFVSPQAGLVTVRALPEEIKVIKDFINETQTHLRRQVIIEAKIMEVTLNDDYQQGIKWDQVLGSIGSTDLAFSTTGAIAGNFISNAIGGTSSLSISNKDFSGVIDLLSTQGNVQVLSSPRITATNNQKAVIKVGGDEYYVTEVSSTTTTGTSTTTTPEINLTPFFSGIALDVTPQIDGNGEVILHVHPSVTSTDEQTKVIKLGNEEIILPLAKSSVRESDTIIRAKSGEIVVIGGLIETRKVELESKTPFLGDIPFMGELFKSKSETTQKKELVIMLKPIVVGQDTWKNQLQDARSLLKHWFPEENDFSQSEKGKSNDSSNDQ